VKSPLSLVAIRFGFMCAFAGAFLNSAWAIPPGGFSNDPRGDVNGDGAVTSADVVLFQHYIVSSGSLAPPKREPARRYGYAPGVENRNTVGNDVVNADATLRHLFISVGVFGCGTADVFRTDYSDGKGDTVIMQRFLSGLVSDPAMLARIHTGGLGDLPPTIPFISFSGKLINAGGD
jgi:hypothetical protein